MTETRTVEIKAKLDRVQATIHLAKDLCNADGENIFQRDIFFKVPEGRLKLRKFEGKSTDPLGELIFYIRPNVPGPKMSFCKKLAIPSKMFDPLTDILSASLGIQGVVVKKRLSFIFEQTRIHIDDVNGLGHFIELETVLRDHQTEREGDAIITRAAKMLHLKTEDNISYSYNDLMMDRSQRLERQMTTQWDSASIDYNEDSWSILNKKEDQDEPKRDISLLVPDSYKIIEPSWSPMTANRPPPTSMIQKLQKPKTGFLQVESTYSNKSFED